MARGTTLATLRTMLRAEIGQTLNTAAATSGDPTLNQFLASEELWLASSLDWPFLDDRWNVTAGPSSRYLNMPTQTIRFWGQRQLLPLVADSDKADLDDLLLVYTVAAELATRLEQKDANVKQAKAGERMRQLRGVYPNRDEKLILGKNLTFQPGLRRVVPLVIVK